MANSDRLLIKEKSITVHSEPFMEYLHTNIESYSLRYYGVNKKRIEELANNAHLDIKDPKVKHDLTSAFLVSDLIRYGGILNVAYKNVAERKAELGVGDGKTHFLFPQQIVEDLINQRGYRNSQRPDTVTFNAYVDCAEAAVLGAALLNGVGIKSKVVYDIPHSSTSFANIDKTVFEDLLKHVILETNVGGTILYFELVGAAKVEHLPPNCSPREIEGQSNPAKVPINQKDVSKFFKRPLNSKETDNLEGYLREVGKRHLEDWFSKKYVNYIETVNGKILPNSIKSMKAIRIQDESSKSLQESIEKKVFLPLLASELDKGLLRYRLGNSAAWFSICYMYSLVGDNKLMIKQMERDIEKDPKNYFSHVLLGRAHLGSGNLNKAVDAFRSANKIEGENFDSHILLGSALKRQKKMDEAYIEYEMASKSAHPAVSIAFFEMADIEISRKNFVKAGGLYKLAKEKLPSESELMMGLEVSSRYISIDKAIATLSSGKRINRYDGYLSYIPSNEYPIRDVSRYFIGDGISPDNIGNYSYYSFVNVPKVLAQANDTKSKQNAYRTFSEQYESALLYVKDSDSRRFLLEHLQGLYAKIGKGKTKEEEKRLKDIKNEIEKM